MRDTMSELETQIKFEEDGSINCTNGQIVLSVIPSNTNEKVTAFKRRAIRKNLKTGETTHVEWLVGELNGVRIYIKGTNLILSTFDLNP